MKYSKYFRGVLHNDGLPQLNAKEWARMMNIAALEYGITKLQKVRELNQNSPEPYKYDLMIRKDQEMHLTFSVFRYLLSMPATVQ